MMTSPNVIRDPRIYASPDGESGPLRDVVTKTFFFTLVLSAFLFVVVVTSGVLP
jgi:hypothetical protein